MIDLTQYGYTEEYPLPDGHIPGRIVEFRRTQYTAITRHGEVSAVLKGSFFHDAVEQADLPCVGDYVALIYNENGPSRITGLLPRRSKFSRADFSGHKAGYAKTILEQVVAVNFDYVFIVTSLNRDFRINRILRYLTQTRASSAEPVIILTKADLCEDFSPQIDMVTSAAPGVAVHAISSHTGFGLRALDTYLRPGKTVVFLGMSGVGKSSLLNVLANEALMDVRQTRNEDASKGSHTTTHRQLFMLPSGAMVIDTPGMRELGLYDATESIGAGFLDVEELIRACRFNDCRHEGEPGCAVHQALADGTLAQSRWEQFQAQTREDRFTSDKARFVRARREMYRSIQRAYKTGLKLARKNGIRKR